MSKRVYRGCAVSSAMRGEEGAYLYEELIGKGARVEKLLKYFLKQLFINNIYRLEMLKY
jgi:hypothetical protein